MLGRLILKKRKRHIDPVFWPQKIERYGNLEAFLRQRANHAEEFKARLATEDALARLTKTSRLDFFCNVHQGWTAFEIRGNTNGEVNWRENAHCPVCQLNSRMRFCLGLLCGTLAVPANARIYLSEQATYGYVAMKKLFPATTGSEYVHDEKRKRELQKYIRRITGDRSEVIRSEDITALSFPSSSLDVVALFEVLEHVPAFTNAISEMARVLRRNGILLLTVPFLDTTSETLTRARIGPDGIINHLLPPEYHGDPVAADGTLCFYHFGWDILDSLRQGGFRSAEVVSCWSPAFGMLGKIFAIVAKK